MGGEKVTGLAAPTIEPGSPPRGRGKGVRRLRFCDVLGITPAWAGKRHINVCKVCVSEDHPRVGGEKWKDFVHVERNQGSPPRGRGKGDLHNGVDFRAGITPAWAGKSGAGRQAVPSSQDHPRVGGEKFRLKPVCFLIRGSPPRGRGKVMTIRAAETAFGITPAWAGKSTRKS